MHSRAIFRTSILAAVLAACSGPEPPSEPPAASEPPAPQGPAIHFVDVAEEVGLDAFHQVSGDADKMYLPASTGAGVALFDADLDGDLDVFLVRAVSTTSRPEPARGCP